MGRFVTTGYVLLVGSVAFGTGRGLSQRSLNQTSVSQDGNTSGPTNHNFYLRLQKVEFTCSIYTADTRQSTEYNIFSGFRVLILHNEVYNGTNLRGRCCLCAD
jgi:hypothetical protein